MINFEQKRSELGLHCSALISDFHCFNDLDSYIELIENFLNYKIDAERFKTNFYEMRRLDCQKEYRWETMLYIIDNLKLKQFQGLFINTIKIIYRFRCLRTKPLIKG